MQVITIWGSFFLDFVLSLGLERSWSALCISLKRKCQLGLHLFNHFALFRIHNFDIIKKDAYYETIKSSNSHKDAVVYIIWLKSQFVKEYG